MRTFWIAAAIILFLPIAYFIFFAGLAIWAIFVPLNPWSSTDCSSVDRGSIASPDGMREARVVYFSCGSALSGYLRDFVVVAVLKSGQSPSSGAIAVEVSEDKERDWRLTQSDIFWQSPSQLQVTLPQSASIDKQKSRVDIVSVGISRVADK